MSLVITSNVGLENNPDTSNVFRPYSYTNHLGNALKIPKNSQIALQSAKINKVGRFVIDRKNGIFNMYFGTAVPDTANNLDDVTSTPMIGTIGNLTGTNTLTLSPEDLAVQIENGMDSSIHHPTFQHDDGVDVVAKYTGGLFDGFTFTFTGQVAATQETPDQDFRLIERDGTSDLVTNPVTDNGTGTLTGDNNQSYFYRQYTKYPIAQSTAAGGSGACEMDFSNANLDQSNSPFRCGLSRYNQKRPDGLYAPEYYSTTSTPQNNFATNEFYDIVIYRRAELLHVAQSSTNAAGELIMRDITYWGGAGHTHATQINIRDDRTKYTKVKFDIQNETMSIFLWDTTGGGGAGVWEELINNDMETTKNQVTNPLNCTKWYLYPTVSTRGTRSIQLENYIYYDHLTENGNQNATSDWWIDLQNKGLQRWGQRLENRDWNKHTNNTYLTAKGVSGTGFMSDYSVQVLCSPSKVFGEEQTALSNSASVMGFTNVTPAPSTPPTAALVQTFDSAEPPKIVSNVSLFIRLNNFGQQSINAKQGTQTSKIIAHLPRFDNSGNETGGLYFEPHERVYIDLNNPNDIYVNTFEVDIVYDNEKICDALTGKTICCFHIKQK